MAASTPDRVNGRLFAEARMRSRHPKVAGVGVEIGGGFVYHTHPYVSPLQVTISFRNNKENNMSKKKVCDCCGADNSFSAPAMALQMLRMNAGAKPETVAIAWEREDGHIFRYDVKLPRNVPSVHRPILVRVVERCVKFVLWAAGGWKLYLSGPDWIVKPIAKDYTAKGARKFDYGFFKDLYGKPFEVAILPLKKMPSTNEREVIVKNNTNGNRIGFDLGASDFKISALKSGKVVFSKEFPWDPRNQPDPEYHYTKLSAGLEEAAKALGGKVDAIGGSTAGTLVGKRLGRRRFCARYSRRTRRRRTRRATSSLASRRSGRCRSRCTTTAT